MFKFAALRKHAGALLWALPPFAGLGIFFAIVAVASPTPASAPAPALPAFPIANEMVTRAAFGEDWPFIADALSIECWENQAVTALIPNGARVGLNIPGRARWLNADQGALRPGFTSHDLYPFIDRGLALCGVAPLGDPPAQRDPFGRARPPVVGSVQVEHDGARFTLECRDWYGSPAVTINFNGGSGGRYALDAAAASYWPSAEVIGYDVRKRRALRARALSACN